MLRPGRPYSGGRILEALEKAQHTQTARELLEALRDGSTRLILDQKLDQFGAAESARSILLHPRLTNIATTLGVLLHEGRHVLDIQRYRANAPKRNALSAVARGRASVGE
jgi:hypothetical protein